MFTPKANSKNILTKGNSNTNIAQDEQRQQQKQDKSTIVSTPVSSVSSRKRHLYKTKNENGDWNQQPQQQRTPRKSNTNTINDQNLITAYSTNNTHRDSSAKRSDLLLLDDNEQLNQALNVSYLWVVYLLPSLLCA